MRRLIYQEGTSNKFWEVRTEGNKMIVRYGRIGTNGSEEEKTFSSADEAQTEMNKLIEQKLAKGYVDESGSSDRPSSEPQKKSEDVQKATPKSSNLVPSLAELDKAISLLQPQERADLNPPAATQQLLQFSAALDRPLPLELNEWFCWHNGQTKETVIVPGDNRRLLSIEESVAAWKFFADPEEEFLKPWRSSWIPLMYNGAGDYVVYETEGSKSGQLINYYHDDHSRPVESKNLTAWVKEACKTIKEYAKSPAAVMPKIDQAQLKDLTWHKIETYPAKEDVVEDPVGTVYCELGKNIHNNPYCCLYLKMGVNEWMSGSSGDRDGAFNDLLSKLQKPKRALIKGGYIKDALSIYSSLKSKGTFVLERTLTKSFTTLESPTHELEPAGT